MIKYTDVYSGQFIPSAAQQNAQLPEKLQELRNLETEAGLSEGELFCRQAKIAENYEDDTVYDRDWIWYHPSYRRMNNTILRAYFGWRTRFRAGKTDENTPLSFIYVHAYEVINGVGAAPGDDGAAYLKKMLAQFGNRDAELTYLLKRWLHDYIVYYDLSPALAPELFKVNEAAGRVQLLKQAEGDGAEEIEKNGAEKFLETCAYFSYGQQFKPDRSAFIKENREDFAKVLVRAYHADAQARRQRGEAMRAIVEDDGRRFWHPFEAAQFYDQKKEYRFDAGNGTAYVCRDGNWMELSEPKIITQKPGETIGDLCRETERLMRKIRGFGRSIKPADGYAQMDPVLKPVILAYKKEKEAAARPKIELDMGRLGQIRQDAAHTRDALLVDEEQKQSGKVLGQTIGNVNNAALKSASAGQANAAPASAPTEQVKSSPAPTDQADSAPAETSGGQAKSASAPAGLTADELAILTRIAAGGDWKGYAVTHRLMLSMVVDSINEKLMELVGDTVLEWDGDRPELINEYREDVQKILEQGSN